MARFKVLETSYIGERIVEPGEVVDIDPAAIRPGPNLEQLDARAPKGAGRAPPATEV